jgi:hypothetical protein
MQRSRLTLGNALAPRDKVLAQEPAPNPVNVALASQVQELQTRVEALEAWVAAQQKQAQVTQKALAEAEAAGFTAGINPRSREVLLDAWNAAAKETQSPLGGSVESKAKGKGKRSGDDGEQR